MLTFSEFAADRDERITEAIDELTPVVRDALILYPNAGWVSEIIEGASVLFTEMFEASGTGAPPTDADYDEFAQMLADTLAQTGEPADPPADGQVSQIATWVAAYTVNAATEFSADEATTMTWTTMRDDAVRDTHRVLDGQTRQVGDTFDVGGYPLSYPGQPVGPPEIWMGCRCLLVPGTTQGGVMATLTARSKTRTPTPRDVFAPDEDQEPTAAGQADESADVPPMPWHGVLAPEGAPTGDGRAFSAGALRHRDLPLPLRYTPTDWGGHDGAVVVGNITKIWREDDKILAQGTFLPGSTYAREAVEQLAGGYLRGVSVDLDDVTMEYDESNDTEVTTDGRIAAATLVPIPAFAEAYVALGDWEMARQIEQLSADGCLPCMQRAAANQMADEQVSDKAWSDFTQADYDIDQWKRATILTKCDEDTKDCYGLPIREPDGTLNRNGVHAAASRFNQVEAPAEAKSAAAASLRGAYDALGEEPPDVIAASAVFAETVEVGDTVSWETTDDEGEIEAHTGTVETVDGDTATVAEGDDTFEVPVADLVIETDGGGEPPFAAASDLSEGTNVTWTEPHEEAGDGIHDEDVTERTGVVQSVDGDTATVVADHDGETYQVLVADLTVAGGSGDEDSFPEQVVAAAFAPGTKDGPGWITNPQDTQRLRTYWVRGEGAAKIRWGQPGDFDRCRNQLRKYITNPEWLAGTCANMHKVALGVWPGQENSESAMAAAGAPFTIVASAGAGVADTSAEAATKRAPLEWFADPELAGPTPLQVTDDGRVFGHLAVWGTCHIGIDGACVTPPESKTGYAFFATGMYCAEGGTVPVGTITLGTGHADIKASAAATVEHYDNTGTAVAYVSAGEDEHGIWISGTLAPQVSEAQRTTLQAATLSGDWRKLSGNLELVAALAVNTPGFPIPRIGVHSGDTGQMSLAAAGVVRIAETEEPGADDMTARVADAVIAALDARDERRRRARLARRALDQGADELAAARGRKVAAARDQLAAALGRPRVS